MLNRPKFKDCFHVEVADAATVFLLAEEGQWVLRGRLYAQLAGLLDGRHSVADVLDALDGSTPLAEVLYGLQVLEGKGYLAEGDDTVPPERAAFWQLLGV